LFIIKLLYITILNYSILNLKYNLSIFTRV